MNEPYIAFEIKSGIIHEVKIAEGALDKWAKSQERLTDLFLNIADSVYYNPNKNNHQILPSLKGDLPMSYQDRLDQALSGLAPIITIPAHGMTISDVEQAVKRVMGENSLASLKGPVDIQLTRDGFIDEASLRSYGFEREVTELDISLQIFSDDSNPKDKYVAEKPKPRKRP